MKAAETPVAELNYQYFNSNHNKWFEVSEADATQALSVGLEVRKISESNSDIKTGKDLTGGLKYYKWLEREIKQLSSTRKHYTIQSEWHRLMYSKVLELETLAKVLF